MFYQIIAVGDDDIGLLWSDAGNGPRVERIILPSASRKMMDRIQKDFCAIHPQPLAIPGGTDQRIADLYRGKKTQVDFSVLNVSGLTDFSVHVLKHAYKIPRGKVATYAFLAAGAGSPKAARAAGSVMAKNPFPLVVPCHRVVRSDGSVGQFGAGSAMKRELLRKEGIPFDRLEKIPFPYLCSNDSISHSK